MCARDAMALLLDRVDTDTIRIVRRWRSNTKLRYLQNYNQTFTAGLEVCMVQHGDYRITPPAHMGYNPHYKILGLA